MHKNIESYIWKYKYWSNKYRSSSQVRDLQQRNIAFDGLMQEATKHNLTEEQLKKLYNI